MVTKSALETVLDKQAPVVAKPKAGDNHHPAKRNKLIVALLNCTGWLEQKKDRTRAWRRPVSWHGGHRPGPTHRLTLRRAKV